MNNGSSSEDASERLLPGPVGRLIVAAFVASALVGAGGWALGGRLAPGMGWAAWPAVGGVAAASLVALGAIRVWRPRPILKWMQATLICQGVRFVCAVALAGVLIYVLPSPARGVGGLTFAAGYLAVVFAESWVLARHFRRVCHMPVDSSEGEDGRGNVGDS